MKKSVLTLSLVVALGGFGVSHAQVTPTQTLPQPAAVSPPIVQTPAGPANVLAPNPSRGATQAVNTLQQTLTQSQTTVTAPAPQSSSAPQINSDGTLDMGKMDLAGTDEGTLIRLMSQYQAKLAFENMLAKIEKASQDRAREKLKFEKEKREADAEEQKLSAPVMPLGATGVGVSPVGVGAQLPLPSGMTLPLPSPQSAIDYMMQAVAPSVRSIYSFDGQYFAEMMTGSTKTIAKNGTKLPNGAVVVSISSSGVVVMNKGKKSTLTVEAPAESSTTTTTTSLTGAPPPIP